METTLAMSAFVRAIERNGFSPAARDLGVTPSAVSKLVSRLERRLGVTLLHRTTRRLALTPEGEIFFERAQRIVDAIADAEAEVMRFGERPRGRLRINVGVAFGTYALVPALPEFGARYPEIELEIALTDQVVDLAAVGADLAIRLGPLGDANLVARKLTDFTRVVCAAPAYLARHGTPRTPDDLVRHRCLTYEYAATRHQWRFIGADGGDKVVRIGGPLHSNNGRMLGALAVEGAGIVCEPDFILAPDLARGALVPILADWTLPSIAIHAAYPSRRHLSAKVRAFVDFLAGA